MDEDELDFEFDLFDSTDVGSWTNISDNVIEHCSDGECQQIDINVNGDTLTLRDLDDEEGCDTTLVYTKN